MCKLLYTLLLRISYGTFKSEIQQRKKQMFRAARARLGGRQVMLMFLERIYTAGECNIHYNIHRLQKLRLPDRKEYSILDMVSFLNRYLEMLTQTDEYKICQCFNPLCKYHRQFKEILLKEWIRLPKMKLYYDQWKLMQESERSHGFMLAAMRKVISAHFIISFDSVYLLRKLCSCIGNIVKTV